MILIVAGIVFKPAPVKGISGDQQIVFLLYSRVFFISYKHFVKIEIKTNLNVDIVL